MKILADPQIFTSQVYGGISRYYTEVLSEIDTYNNVEVDIPVLVSKNEYLKNSTLYKSRHKYYSFIIKVLSTLGISTRKIVKKWNKNKSVKALRKQDYDLYIPTYYDPYFLGNINNKPYVLTVYDMIHELFPEYFSDGEEIRANKLLLMKNAAKIIAVSHNTKKDILKIYPDIEASKIEVVYHGNSIQVSDAEVVGLPDNYILFVGVRDNYKNFEFLIEAASELFLADRILHLVCAGGEKFNAREQALIDKLQLTQQVIQRSFGHDELGAFYKNARCFVFPSMYEGFGIPVLESMACSCPIVLTNNSSFPEVAGEAGIFYELGNKQDLKDKIKSIIYNDALRQEYILKGLEQVKKFNWKEAAEKCYNVYLQALNNKE
jgi:glycosyltransferase involved in cell wall biosynthesis